MPHFPLETTRWRHEAKYRGRPVVDATRGRALGPLGVWGIAVSRLSSGAARSESFRRTCGVVVASLHLPQSLTKPIETEAPLSDECKEV